MDESHIEFLHLSLHDALPICLLSENRNRSIESRRYMDFSERLDDLKAVIMASIATPNLRDTARGAIQFRHLITFLSSLHAPNLRSEEHTSELQSRENLVCRLL